MKITPALSARSTAVCAFIVLQLLVAACTRDVRRETISAQNARSVASAVAESQITTKERKILLAYLETQALTLARGNPDSSAWLPKITIGEILALRKDEKAWQDAQISISKNLGLAFFADGSDIGDAIDVPTFAFISLFPGKNSTGIIEMQRGARFVASAFAVIYASVEETGRAAVPDTLVPLLRLSDGTVMELPRR